jgi:hypothetical protein
MKQEDPTVRLGIPVAHGLEEVKPPRTRKAAATAAGHRPKEPDVRRTKPPAPASEPTPVRRRRRSKIDVATAEEAVENSTSVKGTSDADVNPPKAAPRKAPAPVVGARRSEEPDVLDSNPVAATASADGRRRRKVGAPKEATPTKKTTAKVAEPSRTHVAAPTVPKPAARKVQRSFYVDVDVLEDARAAVTYLGAYVPEARVQSLADLVNPGLAAMVKQLQDTYNDGKPFRRVSHMQVGRPRR